jgi:predicted ATPase/class 3 adenylate cyclase/DNA-binding XRE family transcriptional regulator
LKREECHAIMGKNAELGVDHATRHQRRPVQAGKASRLVVQRPLRSGVALPARPGACSKGIAMDRYPSGSEQPSFGDLLRRYRQAAGLTQATLAKRAGLSWRGINDLERSVRLRPRRETVALLTNALGLVGDERAAFVAAARRRVTAPTLPPTAPGPAEIFPSGAAALPSQATDTGAETSYAPVSATLLSRTQQAVPAGSAALPSGTVTFLFSDIEGSTRLLQRLGEDYARVLGEHQTLLRAAWAAHGGVEVDTAGDSFFVAFPSAPAAVAAAAQATHGLAAHPWPEGSALRVRVGLHTGTPLLAGERYVGLDVHRAARIAAAGHGGQILLSAAVMELARDELPEGAALRDLGLHRLKDLQRPEQLYQLCLPDLPSDFPPLKSLDRHHHNLPVQPTPLIGREETVRAIAMLLTRDDVRLVTLTGPAGIGKTRLAIQVAAEVIEQFPDGVSFVSLAALTDPELVASAVAQTLGLRAGGGPSPEERVRAYLGGKQVLLVLDNFEQVVGAAPLVARLQSACAGLRVLVTSRIALRLRGEKNYAVPPLALPNGAIGPRASAALPDMGRPRQSSSLNEAHLGVYLATLTQYAAVALFLQRAQDAKADFQLTNANALAVAEVCARLDGLPLAIELAAARVTLLPPQALLGRLSSRLTLLTGGARDLPERQQTLRGAIAWSYDLLSPKEQALFRILAVFVGGWTLEAAEAICATPESAEALPLDILDGVGSLVDKSLVRQQERADGEPRCAMLETIREFGLERLAASGEAATLQKQHADYFLGLAETLEPRVEAPDGAAWLDQLEQEHDNLRAALRWFGATGEVERGLRLGGALRLFWFSRGHSTEGRERLANLLALPGAMVPTAARANALDSAGFLARYQGAYTAAQSLISESLAIRRALGDRRGEADALANLGFVSLHQGEYAGARAQYQGSLDINRELGNAQGVADALSHLALAAFYEDDYATARELDNQSLAIWRGVGDRQGIAWALYELGNVLLAQGDDAAANRSYVESLAQARELRSQLGIAWSLSGFARLAAAQAQPIRALRLAGAAAALRELIGMPLTPAELAEFERRIAPARRALGEAAAESAWAEGRALAVEQAISEALGIEG